MFSKHFHPLQQDFQKKNILFHPLQQGFWYFFIPFTTLYNTILSNNVSEHFFSNKVSEHYILFSFNDVAIQTLALTKDHEYPESIRPSWGARMTLENWHSPYHFCFYTPFSSQLYRWGQEAGWTAELFLSSFNKSIFNLHPRSGKGFATLSE